MKSHEEVECQVREELNRIIDPCSRQAGAPAGLVDMGLVRQVCVMPGDAGRWDVSVRISVTHPLCMMGGIFLGEVSERLRAIADCGRVDAQLDVSQMWHPGLMSARYRAELAAVRATRNVLAGVSVVAEGSRASATSRRGENCD